MPDRDREDLERGYTTGTCATATTKAGLLYLLKDEHPVEVTVELPVDETAVIAVQREEVSSESVTFSTVKDAGDDPDVTDGALIRTTVSLNGRSGVSFEGGPGVGTVTRPGLPVEPGDPAINPVPREMMQSVVRDFRDRLDLEAGVVLTVDVEDGRELAERTLNPRLGIEDGLSILGTTGIVEPYSHASYIASIEQGIDVAVENGLDEIVLSTGGRTESRAQELIELPEYGYVQFAGYLRESLLYLLEHSFDGVHFYFMPGKFSKFAQGFLSLHSSDSTVDFDRVRETVERVAPVDPSTRESIESLSSVNQIFSKLSAEATRAVVDEWIGRVPGVLRDELGTFPAETVFVTVLDLEGNVLGERCFSS